MYQERTLSLVPVNFKFIFSLLIFSNKIDRVDRLTLATASQASVPSQADYLEACHPKVNNELTSRNRFGRKQDGLGKRSNLLEAHSNKKTFYKKQKKIRFSNRRNHCGFRSVGFVEESSTRGEFQYGLRSGGLLFELKRSSETLLDRAILDAKRLAVNC